MTRLHDETGEYFLCMIALLIVLWFTASACGCQPGTSGAPAATPPLQVDVEPQHSAEPPEMLPPDLDQLLGRIEVAGKELRGLSGSIIYQKTDGLLNRRELRTGTFAYAAPRASDPERLGVRFDQLIVNSVRRPRSKSYRFDGTWLIEIDEERRTIIRRQVAPAGATVRPLDQDGPVPLLAGQTRDDLISRYEIERFDPAVHEWTRNHAGEGAEVETLRLIPRAGQARAEEVELIDMVLDADTLLPLCVVQTEVGGNLKAFRFRDLIVDPPEDGTLEDQVSTLLPDPLPEGWKVHVEPLPDRDPPVEPR